MLCRCVAIILDINMRVGKSDAQNVLRTAYMKNVQRQVQNNIDHEMQRRASVLVSVPLGQFVKYIESHPNFAGYESMDLDHILPQHAFSEDEKEMCFHWVNFQPLCHMMNMQKGCHYRDVDLDKYKKVFPALKEHCLDMARRHGYQADWMHQVRKAFEL